MRRCFDLAGKYCAVISDASGGAIVLFMVLLITVDVVGRSGFSKSTLIADALSGYMLVVMAFLGLAATEFAGRHITVNVLTRKLSQRKRERLEIAVSIVTLIFVIWLTWILFGTTKVNYVNQATSTDSLHMRVWIPYSAGPLGTGMLAVVLLSRVIHKLRVFVNPREAKKARQMTSTG